MANAHQVTVAAGGSISPSYMKPPTFCALSQAWRREFTFVEGLIGFAITASERPAHGDP
jgi:hypothetical protein